MGRMALVLVMAWAACAAAGPKVQAPEATSAGEAYQEYCRLCHQLRLPPARPRPCEEWKVTVARMSAHRERLGRGAIPPATRDLIAAYLADWSPGR